MDKVCCIDGDVLSFRAAAANEKKSVKAVHNETAESHTFDTATKFKEWCVGVDDDPDNWTLTPQQEAEPVEYAFKTLKQMIENITAQAKCDSYHIVVSGSDNFRLNLPLPTRYKDNRKESIRPLQLADCKNYLIHFQNAEVSEGVEADDVLAGYAYQGVKDGKYIVQATLDKDALHFGWVYDWTKMTEPVLITGYGGLTCELKEKAKKKADGTPTYEKIIKGTGQAWLVFQMVAGDPVDGYKPCELAKVKFGEVGAYELLKDATNLKEAMELAVRQYKQWYPEPITYRAWDDSLQENKTWLDIMQMYADCAFMRRWDTDRFCVKTVLDKLKVEY